MDTKQVATSDEGPTGGQDTFLRLAIKTNIAVSVYLVNGIHMVGRVLSMDKYSFLMSNRRDSSPPQLILKAAVATVQPEVRERR